MYRDHRKGPGGVHRVGHLSRRAPWAEVGGNQPLVGWCAPPWALLRLGLETLGVGGFPLALGGKATPSPPLAAAPPWRSHLPGPAPPQGPI